MEALPQLLPIGGAGAILIFLLSVLLSERKQWTKDRADLIAEHRADIEDTEARHAVAVEFWEGLVAKMNDRIAALEGEVTKLRDELHAALGGGDGRGAA